MATIGNVTVKLERGDDSKFVVKVQVISRKKQGLRASVDVDPGKSLGKPEFIAVLQAAAGSAAEYLGKYGDNIDPEDCTRQVLEAFRLEAHHAAMLAQDTPAKLKAIGENSHRLSNHHLEIYKALKQRAEMPGYIVTHREAKWLNQMIREIF